MHWDLFCRVVDNFGDIGVAWRLAADLAAPRRVGPPRGRRRERARLDGAATARAGVDGRRAGTTARRRRRDVVVETFGCGPAGRRVRRRGARARRCWINLEHLSAEPYVERSARPAVAAARRPGEPPSTTWFFYPGFTPRTGGLLREPGLLERAARASARRRLAGRRAASRRAPASACVSLFCYRNDAVGDAARRARRARRRCCSLTAGRRRRAGRGGLGPSLARGALRAVRLPLADAARLRPPAVVVRPQLRARRGLVRARAYGPARRSSGRPTRRTTAPTRAKLEAFLDRFLAGAPAALAGRAARAVRGLERRRRRRARAGLPTPTRARPGRRMPRWRDALAAQADLATQLLASSRETLKFEALRPARRPLRVASPRRLPAESTP